MGSVVLLLKLKEVQGPLELIHMIGDECASFRKASVDLYNSAVMVARQLCITWMDPTGLMPRKWTYYLRTIPNTASLLKRLENATRHKLIPAITGKLAINDFGKKFIFPSSMVWWPEYTQSINHSLYGK